MNSQQKKLINYCYDLLARRRYSIREMVTKLESRNSRLQDLCTDQELQEIMAALVKANLINDQDYAFFYIDAQLRRKPVGKIKIRQQLRQKGIAEEIIAQSINVAELNETDLAKQLLLKKAGRYSQSQLKDTKVQNRLLRYLASNGFNMGTSYQAIKELLLFHPVDQSDL